MAKCPKCGCQMQDPFSGKVTIHDVEKCCGTGNYNYSEADYLAAIPACCSMQTIEEHVEIMLCWGLSAAVSRNEPMNCGDCEMKNNA